MKRLIKPLIWRRWAKNKSQRSQIGNNRHIYRRLKLEIKLIKLFFQWKSRQFHPCFLWWSFFDLFLLIYQIIKYFQSSFSIFSSNLKIIILKISLKPSSSCCFCTTRIVPTGKHILLFGEISYVLSFVCIFDYKDITKNNHINFNCQSWLQRDRRKSPHFEAFQLMK